LEDKIIMDIAINQGVNLDIMDKIKNISNLCKVSKIEKLLSDCFEALPNKSPVDYVGELNRNDVMH